MKNKNQERMTSMEFRAKYNNLMKEKKKNKFNVAPKPERTWNGFFRGREQTIVYKSREEVLWFIDLIHQLNNGLITELSIREKFLLIEKTENNTAIYYESDFFYYDMARSLWVILEIKGKKTQTYIRNKNIMLRKYPKILFVEYSIKEKLVKEYSDGKLIACYPG